VADLTAVHARVSPRDLFTLPIVGWCALRPDKTAAAYVVTRLHEEANKYLGTVKLVRLPEPRSDTSPATIELTNGSARDLAPQWSSDGSSVFFLSDRSGRVQLWRVASAGGQPAALPELPGTIAEFAVSPAGRYVAAVATPADNKEKIVNQGWRRITRIRYRSDGPGYLDDFPQLWLIDLQTGSARALTSGTGVVAGPAWSHDGTRLAFCGDHEADADSLWRRELWVASAADDWRPKKILTFGTAIEAPAWSPDGTRIAFCGIERGGASGAHNLRLFVADPERAWAQCLTNAEEWTCGNFVLSDVGLAGSVTAPQWLDGKSLLVLASSRGASRVFRIRYGRNPEALTPETMSVVHFADLGESRVLHCSSAQTTPPELYLSHPQSGTAALTHETRHWQGAASGISATPFTVRSAGATIDAWHIAGSGDGLRPCILSIHGGPHFAYGYAYVFHFIALAAAGYHVVFCNPRGSQSYGEALAHAISGDWAQPAFDDCMAVLDQALERFPIDAERLGVAGGSYGGYLTVWTVGHSSRFKAAVALRPATSLWSLWGTSEVGRMLAEDFGGSPYEVPEVYTRDSPLTYAENIRTPLLVVYGGQDFRTPAEQSEQLLTALLKRGATVEGLFFFDADHNLSRTGPPRQRVAHEEAILDWFDRYLR
jgi:dipeptidyl aminopeptidase/acylaminoacyl peptidase